MPRNTPRSPPVPQNMPGFNTYTGQLAVTAADNSGQWPTEGEWRAGCNNF